MKRTFAVATLSLLLLPVALQAQAIPVADAAAGGAAPIEAVNVTNKCCSIWDFLGVNQLGKFINENIFKSRLGQAIATLTSPIGRALGLGPSLLSEKFANSDNPAMAAASAIKQDQKQAPLKIQAIRFLATVDCVCYPEVVDALLAALDDCTEEVRYEALLALHKDCNDSKKHCPLHLHKNKACDSCCPMPIDPCSCAGCQCQEKVIQRLHQLLIERDEFGCFLETSPRIRDLAERILDECLDLHQPPPCPDIVVEEEEEEEDEIVPEKAPTPEPEKAGDDAEAEIETDDAPETTSIQMPTPTLAPVPVSKPVSHSTGYRGVTSSNVSTVNETPKFSTTPAPTGPIVIYRASDKVETPVVKKTPTTYVSVPKVAPQPVVTKAPAAEITFVDGSKSSEVFLPTSDASVAEAVKSLVPPTKVQPAPSRVSKRSKRHLVGEIFGY